MVSRGYCEEQFVWQHLYWTLTDEGIEYIREYMALPAGVVPATKAMANKAEVAPIGGGRGGFGSRGGFGAQSTPAPAPQVADE